MDLLSVALTLLLAYAIVAGIRRTRIKLNAYASNIQTYQVELQKAKEATAENARELRMRNDEIRTMMTKIGEFESKILSQASVISSAKADLRSARTELETLRTRLATSEARCVELQDAAERASIVRWELASRFGNNEEARIALNNLRRPPQRFSLITSGPVPKSPSESFLFSLKPDLSISDTESSDDGNEEVYRTLPSNDLPGQRHVSNPGDVELENNEQSRLGQRMQLLETSLQSSRSQILDRQSTYLESPPSLPPPPPPLPALSPTLLPLNTLSRDDNFLEPAQELKAAETDIGESSNSVTRENTLKQSRASGLDSVHGDSEYWSGNQMISRLPWSPRPDFFEGMRGLASKNHF